MKRRLKLLLLSALFIAMGIACYELESLDGDLPGQALGDQSNSSDLASPEEATPATAGNDVLASPEFQANAADGSATSGVASATLAPRVVATLPGGETQVLTEDDMLPSAHQAASPRHQARFVVWMTGSPQ